MIEFDVSIKSTSRDVEARGILTHSNGTADLLSLTQGWPTERIHDVSRIHIDGGTITLDGVNYLGEAETWMCRARAVRQ